MTDTHQKPGEYVNCSDGYLVLKPEPSRPIYFWLGEPEYVGSMPSRQDSITGMSDLPRQLSWGVSQSGSFGFSQGSVASIIVADSFWDDLESKL